MVEIEHNLSSKSDSSFQGGAVVLNLLLLCADLVIFHV